jgi:hypothetical protein
MSHFNILNGEYDVNYVLQVHLGDAIWSQTLIRKLSNGKPIIWGTESQFVEGLQRAYPDIFWIDVKALNPDYQQFMIDVIIGGVRVIPIGHSNTIMKVPYKDVMKAKYEMYGLDWNSWKDTMYVRDMERELRLFKELGLVEGEKYNFINNRFRSDESGVVNINVNNEYKNIQMRNIKGYSLFDWSYVLENATTINTAGTSINYILELLDLKAPFITLYKRIPDENSYRNYDYILKKHTYIYT